MASILLFNTSFKNKGDALMNDAIVKELGDGHDWAVPASLRFNSRRDTKGYCLCLVSDLPGVTWKQRFFNIAVSAAAVAAQAISPGLRRRFGIRTVRDIDLAIDVSGYCYGDVWGQQKVDWGEKAYERLHRAGARIALMPKTWGPFEVVSTSSVRSMLGFVDIAFARDEQSKRLLDEVLSAQNGKIMFAPDYTHRVASAGRKRVESGQRAYVIPSYRVIDSGALDKPTYYRLLSDARRALKERGYETKLLIHELSNDLRFVADAVELGFPESDVVLIDDPVELKHTISGAGAVVTSRLHGLYNALNSAVPVAVIGWVFKYREALRQYDCEECLVDLANPSESLQTIVEMITDAEKADFLISKMQAGKAESEKGTSVMWAEIRGLMPST